MTYPFARVHRDGGCVAGMARDAVLTIRRNKRASRRVTEDCREDLGKVCELANPEESRQ